MTDKERYATPGTWAKVCREEGVEFGEKSIIKRLERVGVIGITARNRSGRVIHEGFFSESDFRRACADVLNGIRVVDANGFFEIDKVRYASTNVWSVFFYNEQNVKVRGDTIRIRLKEAGKFGAVARDQNGVVRAAYYSESDVRNACADLITNLPISDEEGFLDKEGKQFGTIFAWAKRYGISHHAVANFFKKNDVKPIQGKGVGGNVYDYYPESETYKISETLGLNLPRADADGFVMINGVRYAVAYRWSQVFPFSRMAIIRRIAECGLKPFKALSSNGLVIDVYSETDIREVCSDLLNPLNADYFRDSGGVRADLTAFATQFGGDSSPLDLNAATFISSSITCQDGRIMTGYRYLGAAAVSLGYAKDKVEASKKMIQTLRHLLKVAGFQVLDKSYFQDSKNVRTDLGAFAIQFGEKMSFSDLTVNNIYKLSITAQNGQVVRGGPYLRVAAVALGFAKDKREAENKEFQILCALKEIAGILPELTKSDD